MLMAVFCLFPALLCRDRVLLEPLRSIVSTRSVPVLGQKVGRSIKDIFVQTKIVLPIEILNCIHAIFGKNIHFSGALLVKSDRAFERLRQPLGLELLEFFFDP